MTERKIVALIGMKRCGKSSVGKILAKKLAFPFADTDSLIESRAGKTARQLFLEGGPGLMAEAEAAACSEALGKAERGGLVLSTGGALCENPPAVALLKESCLFCLIEAELDVLYSRILKSAKKEGEMPAYLRGENPKERFSFLYMERMEKYRKMADITVESREETSAEDTADAIIRRLGAASRGGHAGQGREGRSG